MKQYKKLEKSCFLHKIQQHGVKLYENIIILEIKGKHNKKHIYILK